MSLQHYVLSAFIILSGFRAAKLLYSDVKLFNFGMRIYDGKIPWRVFTMCLFNTGVIIDVCYALSHGLSDGRLFVIFLLNTILVLSLTYAAILFLKDMEKFVKNSKKTRW